MKTLTVERVIRLHDRIIDETGGESGMLNHGNLDFTITQALEGFQKEDLFTRAAKLLGGIIKGHPFVDGNKRTGIEATDVFLRHHGWYLEVDVVDGIGFTVAVAMDKLKDQEIKDWLNKKAKRIKSD